MTYEDFIRFETIYVKAIGLENINIDDLKIKEMEKEMNKNNNNINGNINLHNLLMYINI